MQSKQRTFLLLIFHLGLLNSLNPTMKETTTPPITNPHYPRDHIVNSHDFSFILNPGYSVCNDSNSPVYMLVYVHSSPAYYRRRVVIRETWATRTLFPDIRLIFTIGKTLDKELMKAIEYENELYQDIVQEDFMDSYRNLSYKGVMALKWISIYCSQAKYILKSDDDIVINTFTLINHLKYIDKHNPNQHSRLLCLVWYGMHVMRDVQSKWYISRKEYPLDEYPTYCSGSAFVLTGDMPAKMYNASLYIPFFWVDDYYITGAVASAANATYTQLSSLYTISSSLGHHLFMSPKSFYTIMVGHFPGSMNYMRQIWHRISTIQKHKFPTHVELLSFSWDERIHHKDEPIN